MLTEVFKQCYLKAFISLRHATPQNCQSTAGSCNDKALKWRSEPRLHRASSSSTAAWPQLKCDLACFPARLYLSLPRDYKHQVQLMQDSEHQSYVTALPRWETGVAVRQRERCRVSRAAGQLDSPLDSHTASPVSMVSMQCHQLSHWFYALWMSRDGLPRQNRSVDAHPRIPKEGGCSK